VVRLGFYTAEQSDDPLTLGVPSTLAATILAAAVLARVGTPAMFVAAAGIFTILMVTRIPYPDLLARDTLIMGTVQGLTVFIPTALGRAFPYALLTLGLAYLVLGPRFYWREV
jgi:CDP-diacylglycerol--serine O-phosphatidyltransferase